MGNLAAGPRAVSVRGARPTLRGEWAHALVGGLPQPVGLAALCRLATLTPDLLWEPLCRVPTHLVQRVMERAAVKTGHPIAGLRAMVGHHGRCFFRHLFAAQSDVRDALEQLRRFGDLALGGVAIDLSLSRRAASLTLQPATGEEAPPVLEACLVYVLRLLKEAAGPAVELREVGLRGAPRTSPADYEGVFRAPVSFGCPAFTLTLAPSSLDLPMRRANPRVARELEEAALLEQSLQSRSTYSERVADLLRAALMGREPVSRAEVSRRLVVTSRALDRFLRCEGRSFREIEQRVRREVAVDLLAEDRGSLEQTAERCGFSDLSAFSRAFKRWTGVAPSVFRRARPVAT